MSEISGAPQVHHDPLGPVSVVGDIPMADLRDALGPGAWLERCSIRKGLSLMVTTRADLALATTMAHVPCVYVGDDAVPGVESVQPGSLGAWLRAFSDGGTVSGREAEVLRWMDAVRAEEEREQARAAEMAVRGQREAEAAEAATRAQLDRMNAHIAAMEASRAWRVGRRISAAKASLSRLVRRSSP